ncbi:MAG: hypothetical protein AB2823_09880 [Candidatus Thiodiazotropha endolucinida]
MVGAELDNAEALFLMHFVAVRQQKALAGAACFAAEHGRFTGAIEIRMSEHAGLTVSGHVGHDRIRGQ